MKAIMALVMSFLIWFQGLPMVNPLDIGSCHWMTIDPHGTQQFELIMEDDGGAVVTVHSDGAGGLELYVYDEYGNLIGSDTESQDTLTVWIPAGTVGWVTIHVVDSSGNTNSFTICVN